MGHRSVSGGFVRGLIAVVLVGAAPVFAATTDVGTEIEAQGGSPLIVNAGDAIRTTCLGLAGAQSRTPEQVDLFARCGEMSRTFIAPSAGYQFETSAERFDAVRQFSGEETSSQGRFATENTNRQFAAIGARIDAIRRGASMGTIAYNDGGWTGGAASAEEDADVGFGWFTNANFGTGDRDQTENESEYDFDATGTTVGIDYAFTNGLVLGAAFGYADYEVDYADDVAPSVNSVTGGEIDSDGYTASLFASYAGARFYWNAIASTGENDFDLERRAVFTVAPIGIVDRTFTADTESQQVAGQATLGMVFGEGAITYDLYVGADYLSIEVDGYTENEFDNTGGATPGLALTFGDQDIDSVQSILGFMVRMTGNTALGVLQPYAGVEWRHEFDNESRILDYRYAFAVPTASPSFATPTDDPDEDYAEVTIGLSAQLMNQVFTFVQYDTSVALEDTSANRITIGLRGTF